MTDHRSGTDNEADALGQEDLYAMPEGGEADTWQGDLPPADDFHDEATGAEIYQDEPAAEPFTAPSAQDEAKKRGQKVLIAVVGVIAVFGGGIAYMNMSNTPILPVAIPAVQIMGGDVLKPRTDNATATVEAEPVAPRTGETDITGLYAKTNTMAGAAVALPTGVQAASGADKTAIAAKQEAAPTNLFGSAPPSVAPQAPVGVPAAPAAPSGEKPAAPATAKDLESIAGFVGSDPSVEAVAAIPPVGAPPAPVQPSVSEVPPALPSTSFPPAAPVSQDTDRRVQEMTAEIASLKASLDQAVKNTAELTQKLEQSAQAERAARQEVDTLARKASKPAEIRVHDAPSDLYAASDVPVKKKSVAVPKKRVVERKVAAKKASRHGWILRAATPDAAWVSRSGEGSDLERVYVGDVLDGIGTVTAIRQKGEAWEVVGSKGSIR